MNFFVIILLWQHMHTISTFVGSVIFSESVKMSLEGLSPMVENEMTLLKN